MLLTSGWVPLQQMCQLRMGPKQITLFPEAFVSLPCAAQMVPAHSSHSSQRPSCMT